MDQKEIIELLEKAVGESFNEETIGKVVDERLQKALEPIDKKLVKIGELADDTQPENVTFSQFLGDVRRVAMQPQTPVEQSLKFLKPGQLVGAKSNINEDVLPPEFKKDLSEGTNSAGGYLVPTEESRELLNVATSLYSVVPGLCRQVPMRTKQITFPTLTSGLTAYWVPEATATIGLTPDGTQQTSGEKYRSDVVLGQMAIIAYVCAVKVVVSNQLLDDSDPAVDEVLKVLFAETLGDAWGHACLGGAGTATDPITGLNSRITTNALQAGAVFNYDDMLDLFFGVLDNDAKANPVAIGTTKAEKKLMKIKDNDGQYVYKSPREPLGTPTVWGQPWHRDGNISNVLGTNSDETRLYAGDFRRHAFAGRRMGLIIKTNPWAEPMFSFNQTAFLAEFRVGFNVDDEKYFSKMDGVPTS